MEFNVTRINDESLRCELCHVSSPIDGEARCTECAQIGVPALLAKSKLEQLQNEHRFKEEERRVRATKFRLRDDCFKALESEDWPRSAIEEAEEDSAVFIELCKKRTRELDDVISKNKMAAEKYAKIQKSWLRMLFGVPWFVAYVGVFCVTSVVGAIIAGEYKFSREQIIFSALALLIIDFIFVLMIYGFIGSRLQHKDENESYRDALTKRKSILRYLGLLNKQSL